MTTPTEPEALPFEHVDMRRKNGGLPFCFAWSGCPAQDACLSRGMPGALCRACSRAKPKFEKARERYRRGVYYRQTSRNSKS